VALKVLHPELAQTLGPERFERKIEVAARHGRAPRANQRVRPATSQVGTTFPSRQNFYFRNGGLPPAFSGGTSSRPRNQAFSRAPRPFLRRGGARDDGVTFAGPLPEQETTGDNMGQQT
jgi:hypothetical protein